MPILAEVTLFIELSVKYIAKSFAVLWQHVFQAVVCIECRAECKMHGTTIKKIIVTTYCKTCGTPQNVKHYYVGHHEFLSNC
jgi:hypothetical protein